MSGAIKFAIQRAVDDGMIIIAAAGNYVPWVVFPARLPSVIAVAACNINQLPWEHSSYGKEVTVTAPVSKNNCNIVSLIQAESNKTVSRKT